MPYLEDTVSVSGALFVPQGFDDPCGLPIHVYMHGTIFKRTDAPSFMSIEGTFGGLMSTLGQLVLMPDYVGLGTSELMHPYVHARSESDAGYFMMKAASTLSEELAYTLNGQNFISGYSQGGHAAMALARDLATTPYGDDFPLTAAVPGSGPYDISGTQFPLTFESSTYSNPAYLAYNVIGWNSYYGSLYNDISEIFQEPYASTLPPLFDGNNDAATINNACPATLEELMQPGLIGDILADPAHPFMVAAQDNDVYQWIPDVPVEMYYCTQDEQVFYQNALTADTWMTENGGTMHTATNLGAYDHGQCAGLAIFGGTLWIEDQVEECATAVRETGLANFKAFPNPASDVVTLHGLTPAAAWSVRSMTGAVAKLGQGSRLDVQDLPAGMWLVVADGFAPQVLSVTH
ncbi:MAG: T9SS type A sorting domain-containing protein [Flavobacteriales bacterium]|nr:T9SS type A sorting domain-containing protein [Flavobacteriales bacterium]